MWLPLCLLFLAPFLPGARAARPTGVWSLLHLDLLVLLGFSISLAFFNHALIGLSVPLAYPFLLYLLVRMLLLAFGKGRPRRPLRLLVPATWLAVGVVFLVGFRVGLNLTNSNVIDVGYAGVIGAVEAPARPAAVRPLPVRQRPRRHLRPGQLLRLRPVHGDLRLERNVGHLPAAHASRDRLRRADADRPVLPRTADPRSPTGIVLAYLWAAYPFTLYTLSANSNDSLVAMLLVLAMLAITSAPARGVATALAGLAKFAPLILFPLFARGEGSTWPPKRKLVAFTGAFALTAVIVMLPVILDNNFHTFWHDSLESQIDRTSPFSVWGLWGGLNFEQHLVQASRWRWRSPPPSSPAAAQSSR